MNSEIRGGLVVSPQQANVVDRVGESRVTVVSAGAGSGKTHTTVAAVLQLVEDGKAHLHDFILITFTNQAADELRDRLATALEGRIGEAKTPTAAAFWRHQLEALSACYVGTIHSFCLMILQTFGYEERVARRSGVTFARQTLHDSFKQAMVASYADSRFEPAIKRFEFEDYRLLDVAERVLDFARNHGWSPATVANWTEAQPDDEDKRVRSAVCGLVAEGSRRYEEAKYEHQRLDSHDLLGRTVELLTGPGGPRVIGNLRRRYRYLFVDEFQDTDHLQKEIVDSLKAELEGVFVVGDRKQSIFGFRSADVSLLEQIAQENGTDILSLSISRRPTRELLLIQNELFRGLAESYPDLDDPLEVPPDVLPRASHVAVSPFAYITATDGVATAGRQIGAALKGRIVDPKTRIERPVQPRDIVVLARSNQQLKEYEEGLTAFFRGTDVLVQRVAGGTFFQRPEIVGTYRMLRLVLDYPDDTALLLASMTPYLREVRLEGQLQEILRDGVEWGTPLTTWLESGFPDLLGALRMLRNLSLTEPVSQVLASLYQGFGIVEYYTECGDMQAVANLEKLREFARTLFADEQALTLCDFVRYLELACLSGREESEAKLNVGQDEARSRVIRLMTIHRAKGLEFPIVVIPEVDAPLTRVDLEPDFLVVPEWGLDLKVAKSDRFDEELARSRDNQLDEEMRILYVAITRACHSVIMVGSRSRRQNDRSSPYYSWQDEIRRLRSRLEAVGAYFQED